MKRLDVDRCTRVLISIPVPVLEELDAEARRLELTRSEFIRRLFQAWKDRLPPARSPLT